MSWSIRGELARPGSPILIGEKGSKIFGKARGAWLELYFAEPREMGTAVVAGLAGAACEFCGVSCPKAGEIGPPTSVTAKMVANSGRADSVFIVLLTLEIMSPRGLNLILLISVKRLQNGICFTPRSLLELYLECNGAHVPRA